MIDIRQTYEYAQYLTSIGWATYSDPTQSATIFIKKIPLTPFSILKLQRPTSISLPSVLAIIRKHRIIISYIEPSHNKDVVSLLNHGYHLHHHPFLPSKTLQLNLNLKPRLLLAKMRPTTKDNILSANRRHLKVVIITGQQLLVKPNLLAQILSMNQSPSQSYFALLKTFKNNCYSVVAYFKNQTVAFTTYLMSIDQVEQYASGSTKLGKKLKAPSICTWNGILHAQKLKKKIFDFGGIYDARFPLKSWQGFTQYKLGFGCQEKLYPGLYYRWHWPF